MARTIAIANICGRIIQSTYNGYIKTCCIVVQYCVHRYIIGLEEIEYHNNIRSYKTKRFLSSQIIFVNVKSVTTKWCQRQKRIICHPNSANVIKHYYVIRSAQE